MPALPYLQTRESDSPVSSEKGPYRLSLHDSLSKTAHQGNGHTRDSANVNKSHCYSQEDTLLFEGASNVSLRDVQHFRTPLPTPSASRNSKRPPRLQDNLGQPTWVDPLGIWLPNKRKWNQYETFSKHVQLLHRTSDAFLDPFPHIPRCSHERTISALRRQRHRLETEGELKRLERNMRIIERVQQIREVWERWTRKANNFGAEHQNRLINFRKTRDVFTDPGEIIREKREERLHREREVQQERQRKRREMLEKKRTKLPKIIVTQYEEDIKQEQNQTTLPSLGNISCASGQNNGKTDIESEENRGNKLEVPQLKSVFQSECDDAISQIESEQDAWHSSEQSGEVENVTEVGSERASEGNNLAVELESVVLEDKATFKVESVVALLESMSEPPKPNLVSQGLFEDTIGTESEPPKPNLVSEGLFEDTIGTEELESQLDKESANAFKNELEQDSINSSEYNGRVDFDERDTVREKELNGDHYGSEKKTNENFYRSGEGTELKEKQMNYLLPPTVSALVGERFADNGSIGDADDTASLMATFTPVPLGVGNGMIPSDALRASSVFDRYHVPSQARLNNSRDGRKGGAWKPKISDQKQYLEVDLGAVTNVMQVATQGCPCAGNKIKKKDKCWVESYTLSFSTDGSNWRHCTENGTVKVFRGNTDNNSVVLNSIAQPEEARFVRFIPQSWKNSIAMRVEVYGEVPEPDLSNMTPIPESGGVPQEVILEEEEEEQVQEFLCDAEVELQAFHEQDCWEEDTVQSVVETASELQSQVATVSRSLPSPLNLASQGETQTSKTKRKPRKPKDDKTEKKKKKKKGKVKEPTLPTVVTGLSLLGDVEEEGVGHSSEEEHEEERPLSSPPIPEVHKRPESVKRMSPAVTRQFSMFPVRKESQEDRPRWRRAQTDDSIRSELLRQQVAEDRRRKLEEATSKTKRDVECQSPVLEDFGGYGGLDDFLEKYCIISEGQAKYYRRIFNNFDDDKDGFLFAEDILEALESVNSNLLSGSHLNYIYRVLELCDCNLHSGADFKLFSVIAAFSQRVAVLDEFAKILISKLDFRELDYKLQRAKRLFLCYVDEEKKTISLEELMLGLTAGGLTDDQKEQTLQVLGRTACLDFLDFLTYIPLFIHIHDHILQDPVGTVVYRSYLAT